MRELFEYQDWPKRLQVGSTALLTLVMLLIMIAVAESVQAQTFTTLHIFEDRPDGSQPSSSLVMDRTGNLYGTTYLGGTFGAGTIFEISQAGVETVLYSFTGSADGGFPRGGLLLDSRGTLYGTTAYGGDLDNGTVFKFEEGTETVLYSFGVLPDGATPSGSLSRDRAGNFFGTTVNGGDGIGTVFKIDTNGAETVLYSFALKKNGASPQGGVILDPDGNLYGTASSGGRFGRGVVFTLDTGNIFTVLYSFTGKADGASPQAGLTRDQTGNLYGTTSLGGHIHNCNQTLGCGTVFKLDTSGQETVLYAFNGRTDGAFPYGSLVLDGAGNLYGTASNNGSSGYGTLFTLTEAGKLTVLQSFSQNNGSTPTGTLFRDAIGNIYGTTQFGGDLNCDGGGGCGTVFKLVP